MKHKFIAAIEITRPVNSIMGSLTVLIGALFVSRISLIINPQLIVLPVLVYICIAGGSNVINDYFDINIDKINRPQRPIPSGRLKLNEAKALFIILNVIAVLITVFIILVYSIHWFLVLIVFSFIYVGYFYAKSGKRLGFIGNLIVGISFSFGVIFGSMVASNFEIVPNVVYSMFFTSFGMLVSRELVKGVQDMEGDQKFRVNTIANLYGKKFASRMAQIFIIISIIPLLILLSTERTNPLSLFLFSSGIGLSFVALILLLRWNTYSAGKISFFLKMSGLIGIVGFLWLAVL